MEVQKLGNLNKEISQDDIGLYIFAAGFECRSTHITKAIKEKLDPDRTIALKYYGNRSAHKEANAFLKNINGDNEAIHTVNIDTSKPHSLYNKLKLKIEKLPNIPRDKSIYLDVSGLASFAICEVLHALYENFKERQIRVLYTSAKNYKPTKEEYKKLASAKKLRLKVSSQLSKDMAQVYIPLYAKGDNFRSEKSILILLAGYERNRSAGVVEELNPSKIVFVYGKPPIARDKWRLDLSVTLHSNFNEERPKAERTTSTLQPMETFDTILEFYDHLYDDYKICIAPINSKMQTVAAFLAHLKYPDIQLAFPMPKGYLHKDYSEGVSNSYILNLPKVYL